MFPRRSAPILLLAALAACTDARAPVDVPACATEVECFRLYREALLRLQLCMKEIRAAGYVSPGASVPPRCDGQQAETTALGNAVARYHDPQNQRSAGGEDHGFEVPPLPAPTKAPSPAP